MKYNIDKWYFYFKSRFGLIIQIKRMKNVFDEVNKIPKRLHTLLLNIDNVVIIIIVIIILNQTQITSKSQISISHSFSSKMLMQTALPKIKIHFSIQMRVQIHIRRIYRINLVSFKIMVVQA